MLHILITISKIFFNMQANFERKTIFLLKIKADNFAKKDTKTRIFRWSLDYKHTLLSQMRRPIELAYAFGTAKNFCSFSGAEFIYFRDPCQTRRAKCFNTIGTRFIGLKSTEPIENSLGRPSLPGWNISIFLI